MFLIVFAVWTSLAASQSVSDLLPYVIQQEREAFQGLCDDLSPRKEFDFVVVGAGAAGCALASRLTEGGRWSVLLLEAGGEEAPLEAVPYFNGAAVVADDWGFQMGPTQTGCVGFPNGTCSYPRGRVMGGSTTVNGMNFMRGNRYDYDNWANLGNTGWGWSDVLPFFKKLENMLIPELRNSSYHGTEGYVPVSYSPYEVPGTAETFAAAAALGIQPTDYNGDTQKGMSRIQFDQRGGTRVSANRAYLFPARGRKNLFLRMRSLVRRVLLRNGAARGVEYERGGEVLRAYAKKEVILCAGAIMSPVLLMLSGIGPREHLESLGISVEKDLPVGENLMDHPAFIGLLPVFKSGTFSSRSEIVVDINSYLEYYVNGTGALSWADVESIRFFHVGNDSNPEWINMEAYYIYSDVLLDADSAEQRMGVPRDFWEQFFSPLQGQLMAVYTALLLRPRSRGYVRLQANNVTTPPLIDPRMLTDEQDVEDLAQGVAEAARIFDTAAMRQLGVSVYNTPVPGCEDQTFASLPYWRCAVRIVTHNMYHPSGTTKMAPSDDPTGVVNPDLKVRGFRRLRVVDASIFPVIPAAHTMAPVYMVAEKAADMIKQEYGVPSTI